jgi:hypothetical protein
MKYLLTFTVGLLISLVLFSPKQTRYVPYEVSPVSEVNSLQVKPVDPNGRRVLGDEVQGVIEDATYWQNAENAVQ